MNKPIIVLLFFATLIAGYLVFGSNKQTGSEGAPLLSEEVALTGTVTAVDRSQLMLDGPTLITFMTDTGQEHTIAAPSMGSNLCAAAERIADVGQIATGDTVSVRGAKDEAGAIVPCAGAEDLLTITGRMLDSTYGYEFSYHKGPLGYVTQEDNSSTHHNYVTGILLFEEYQYEAFTNSEYPRESPPAMRVRIYQNPQQLSAAVWTMRNESEVNHQLMTGVESEAVVGGANATHFVTDGLFTTEVYVVAHGAYIYVLMGDYFDAESTIHDDFTDLVNSFTFIPTAEQMGGAKINPQVACESALAYMSFSSGEDADAFVTACVNGEHPEVIQRYLQDNGFDGTRI